VLRWPVEQITEANSSAKLIRINLEHPEVPDEILGRSIMLGEQADTAIGDIAAQYFSDL